MVKPFLKWPGGKRWLAPFIKELLEGTDFSSYHEPFLGSGSIFFNLLPLNSYLSDINSDLINTYKQVKERPEIILSRLRKIKADKDTYLRWRKRNPKNETSRAVRFLYLNRNAFAGLYRVNKEGKFNVPYGGDSRDHSVLWRENLILSASAALKNAKIQCQDFSVSLEKAHNGSLVYCDPTYTVMHNNNGFKRYNENNFKWEDQERLALACLQANERGATIIISNAFHNDIQQLYPSAKLYTVKRHSNLCPDSSKRKTVQESVFLLR